MNFLIRNLKILKELTGQTQANRKTGIVDNASNHLQPSVGIMSKAKRTSKQAPKAQKLCGKKWLNILW
jgi:hypothetical protein